MKPKNLNFSNCNEPSITCIAVVSSRFFQNISLNWEDISHHWGHNYKYYQIHKSSIKLPQIRNTTLASKIAKWRQQTCLKQIPCGNWSRMPQFAPQTLRPYRYRQLDCYRWNPPAQHSPSQSSGQSLKVIPQTLDLSWRKFVRRVFACFTFSTRDPGPGWSFGSSGWISAEFGVFFQGCRCQKILRRKILDCLPTLFWKLFFLHRFFKPLQSQQVLPFPTCPQATNFVFPF